MTSVTRNSVAVILALLPVLSWSAQQVEAPLSQGPARQTATAAAKSYAPYPQPAAGYVTDNAGLLSAEERDRLNNYCYTTEKETGVEVVVVTINSINDYPGTANSSIETFATGLFNAYGIGNLPKNDGVLLLVARQDRKVRIELGAYYGRSRDGDSQKIIDKEILPYFRKDQYEKGITSGTKAIIEDFAHLRIGFPWGPAILVGLIIILIPVCISLFRNGKRGWGWVVVGIIIVLIIFLFKTGWKFVEAMPKGSSAGGFGRGFGGGSSGGGGATGSW